MAGALNKRSPLSQVWAAYKDDRRKRGRLEETIYNYEPMLRDTVIPKYGRRTIATINIAVIEDMLDHVGRERAGSTPHILKGNILSGMFRFGIRVGALPPGNPVRGGVVTETEQLYVDRLHRRERRRGS